MEGVKLSAGEHTVKIKFMIDVIIPVRTGTKPTELKYALRSLEKNLNGFGNIFIIGEQILSLRGLKYLHCKDDKQSKWKERNIMRKIMTACKSNDVSEDFIFTNDDIYLTQEFDANNLPFYHKDDLLGTMAKNNGDYRKSVNHTRKFLVDNNMPTLDFDTHFPIVYNKKKFSDTFVCEKLNWEISFGFVIKSLYCNSNGIEGEFGGDCKIQQKLNYEEIKAKIGDRSFFSTSDNSMNEHMIRYLNELYPNKSKYER